MCVNWLSKKHLTLQAPTPQNGQTLADELSMFARFVGLALKGLKRFSTRL